MATAHGDAHGRSADRPSDIPKAGWLDVLKRMKDDFGRYELDVVAAGIAFNEFFALFPAIVAAISIYGLVADPQSVEQQMGVLAGFLPGGMQDLVRDQLRSVASAPTGGLGWSLVISLLIALYSATRGIKALISGLNIVHNEDETRGFIAYNLMAFGLTLAAIVFGMVALVLVAGLPAILDMLPISGFLKEVLSALRWPVLGLFILVGLAVVYSYAPSRDRPRWRWVSWGAAVATVLWLAGSALFSLYVARFGSFNETYGSLAAVAITLLWFDLTAMVVLLGALLDAELEHQTARDTTAGPERPIGSRGAHVADTLGETRGEPPRRKERPSTRR